MIDQLRADSVFGALGQHGDLPNLRDIGYQFDGLSDLFSPEHEDDELHRDGPALNTTEHSDTAYLTDKFLEHMTADPEPGWCAHLA